MEKFVPFEKRSKKEQEQFNKMQRTSVSFNTGTRVHKTDKHPSRARQKQMNRRDDFER